MKRKLALQVLGAFMALAAVLLFSPAVAYANQVIPVFVNGERVVFNDVHPTIRNDRTLVPMRGVFEHMGFNVQWNPTTYVATLSRPGDVVTVRRGDNFFTINGIQNFPDVPPQIIGDRFMLPIRAIAEASGADVRWDYGARMVIITTGTVPPPPPPPAQAPVITTSTLPGGNVGQSYHQTVSAIGAGVTWTLQSGNLPVGLNLNTNTGVITGTPTTAGTFTFTVRASNNGGQASATFTIVIQQQTSTIVLPNRRVTDAERDAWIAEYRTMGGATVNELEVVRLINIERANHGLAQVQADERLMMAARFFAQQANDLRGLHTGTHNFGPYATNPSAQHGASANVAAAFGGNLSWSGGNWFSGGGMSAEALVSGWMNSTGHRNYILAPEHRFIGMGQFPGGISYLFLSDHASTIPGQQFTVTFNANGGTGTMAQQTFQQGVSQALRANTFTRTGHSFAGWRNSPTGAAQYSNQQSITVSANRTLYAVWTTGHTVTFNSNGGTGTMAPQIFQPGVSQALRANTFTRSGHTFVGWRSTPTGTSQYNNSQSITVTSSRTLYAVWTPAVAPTITTGASLPAGTVGVAYNQTLAATGGTPITWAVTIGSLPAGLSLNTSTGAITGTPTATGTFNFTIRAQNSLGNNSRAFTLVINAGTVPAITTAAALPAGTVGSAYSQTLAATGATPMTWSHHSGNLPPGLNFNATTRVISGTPTQTGTFTFTIRAQNSVGHNDRTFTLVVNAGGAPVITTAASLPAGTVSVAYSQTLVATGATPITWTRTAGTLPNGLTLNTNGTITGTPTVAGTFTFTVRAQNAAGNNTRVFTIIVNAGTVPNITTASLPNGTVNTAYSQTLVASGATPITWSVSAGALPTGLTLNANGTITGTPTATGTFTFTARAQNSAGQHTRQFTITIAAAAAVAPSITTATLPNGTVGTAYSQTLAATGTAPITWTISAGALPAGLTLNSNGTITGTPTSTGTSNFTVRAINSAGQNDRVLTITINAPAAVAPSITTPALAGGTVGTAYSQTLAATGTAPITWSITGGGLPPGLFIDSSSGAIVGTPTADGTFTFTVTANNAAGSNSRQFTVTIQPQAPVPVQVPNVVGMHQDAAAASLNGAGFSVGFASPQNSDTVPSGHVISQSSAGSELPGTVITITISLGPAIIDPGPGGLE